jgi:hypothetical protein
VTADGNSGRQPRGILGGAAELGRLGVRVVTDAQAVAIVANQITVWETTARRWAAMFGQPVPSWVGSDPVLSATAE